MSEPASPPTGYRLYLAREMEQRCQKNARYSLRAYARDLGLQPGKLSEILRGRCGLSGSLAAILAAKLRLGPADRRHFIALVEAEHARSPLRRAQAENELKTIEALKGFSEVDSERFQLLSGWQHFAIHELFLTRGFDGTTAAAAEKLQITLDDAQAAMGRLATFGLLRATGEGRWERIEASLGVTTKAPSLEIRRHHRELLSKARESLDTVDSAQRDISSLTLSIPEAALPQLRDMITDFRRRVNREMEDAVGKDRVYCLNVSLFPLDRKETP